MSKTIEILDAIDDAANRQACFTIHRLTKELRLLLAAPVVERQAEPVAWMRKWAADGITPEKVKNENGRMAWPFKFKLIPVSQAKCLPDDVALYTSPPAPVAVVLPPDPEKSFLEWASTLPSPPRCLQSYLAAIDKIKELNQ